MPHSVFTRKPWEYTCSPCYIHITAAIDGAVPKRTPKPWRWRSLPHKVPCYLELANACHMVSYRHHVNTLRPRQNERHFADDIFKYIFLNENVWIPIKISLKFVPKGRINNIPALVQIMAWRRPGDKPLSEPMMVSLPTQICVTRPHEGREILLIYVFYTEPISSWFCIEMNIQFLS